MKKLALLGASGHGKVVADIAVRLGWQKIVFFDDAWPARRQNGPWPVIGDFHALRAQLNLYDGVFVSIGDCAIRWAKHVQIKNAGGALVTLIHPTAYVSQFAHIGLGSVVMASAVVNVDAVLGEACIVNTGATVDHDCNVGNAVHVAPGAHLSGNVTVGDGAWIGLGALLKQGIAVGKGATVGAGSVVLSSVPDAQTVVGVPARPLTR